MVAWDSAEIGDSVVEGNALVVEVSVVGGDSVLEELLIGVGNAVVVGDAGVEGAAVVSEDADERDAKFVRFSVVVEVIGASVADEGLVVFWTFAPSAGVTSSVRLAVGSS